MGLGLGRAVRARHQHALLRRFAATVDGEYQTLGAKDGAYNLEHFFGLDPELQALVAHMTPAEIDALSAAATTSASCTRRSRAARAHAASPP